MIETFESAERKYSNYAFQVSRHIYTSSLGEKIYESSILSVAASSGHEAGVKLADSLKMSTWRVVRRMPIFDVYGEEL